MPPPSAARRGASSNDGRDSLIVTRAPRRCSSSAAATPLRAAPTTTTRRPATENVLFAMSSPQLQRGETEQGKDHRHDQEPGDDLGLAPPDQLEVVVERRHLEDALAGELERGHLNDDRQSLENPDAAHDRQQ